MREGADDRLLAAVRHGLRERYGIGHTTIQLEVSNGVNDCEGACGD